LGGQPFGFCRPFCFLKLAHDGKHKFRFNEIYAMLGGVYFN